MIKKREIFRFEETDEVFNNELARYLLNSSLASDREEGRLGKLQDTSSHLKTEWNSQVEFLIQMPRKTC